MINLDKINEIRELERKSDRKILLVLVGYFLNNATQDFQNLLTDLKSNRVEDAGARAHALKSNCGNLGIVDFYDDLSWIEEQIVEYGENVNIQTCISKAENMVAGLGNICGELTQITDIKPGDYHEE